MQHCCSETLLQKCAAGDSGTDSTHVLASSCSMEVVGSVLCAVVLSSYLTCPLAPGASATGRDGRCLGTDHPDGPATLRDFFAAGGPQGRLSSSALLEKEAGFATSKEEVEVFKGSLLW